MIDTIRAILIAVCLVLCAVDTVYVFIRTPRAAQIKTLKEWLKYAVTLAETELGGGTGQLKLRYVYDLFVGKFPKLSKWLSFDSFSDYVDDALEWMNKQLESNAAIKSVVKNESTLEVEK